MTKVLSKVIQQGIHARGAAVLHDIGAADSLSVHPVFHQLIKKSYFMFGEITSRRIYLIQIYKHY